MNNTEDIVKDLDQKISNMLPNKEDTEEKVAHTAVEDNSSEYDEDEQKALSLGWKPEGKKKAKQWLEDYPLVKEINKLSKENKDLAKLLQNYINEQTNEKNNKKEQEIVHMRREAIKMGDVDLVEQIDKQRESIKTPTPQVDQAFVDFYERYPTLFKPSNLEELEIRDFFLQKDAQLGNHLSPKEHMGILEQAILKKFPKYFNQSVDEEEDDSRMLTNSVESGIQSNVKRSLRKKYTERDLTPEQLDTFRGFQKYKIPITIEKYIETLIKQGDLK